MKNKKQNNGHLNRIY